MLGASASTPTTLRPAAARARDARPSPQPRSRAVCAPSGRRANNSRWYLIVWLKRLWSGMSVLMSQVCRTEALDPEGPQQRLGLDPVLLVRPVLAPHGLVAQPLRGGERVPHGHDPVLVGVPIADDAQPRRRESPLDAREGTDAARNRRLARDPQVRGGAFLGEGVESGSGGGDEHGGAD